MSSVGEIVSGTQGALEQFAQVDSLGAFVTGLNGKKVLNVNVENSSALPTGTNVIGGNFSTVTSSTSNQCTTIRILTASSTAVAVKAAAGNMYGFRFVNRHYADIFIKIYNKAAAGVNPASDTPIFTLPVPAGGAIWDRWSIPETFSTAISVRAVTENTDTGTTAPVTLPIIEISFA